MAFIRLVYDSAESKFDLRAMIRQSFREPFTTKEAQAFCPLKDASRTKRLVPWQHESGLFVMMIRINDRKRDTVHESFFGIPSYVEEHGHAHYASLPGTRQSLQFLKSLLCIGLGARRFRHRHPHLLRQRDGGCRNQDD